MQRKIAHKAHSCKFMHAPGHSGISTLNVALTSVTFWGENTWYHVCGTDDKW